MTNFAKTFAMGIVAVIAVGASGSKVSADYAVTVIKNCTNNPISAELQWGNGEWKSLRIEPGHTYSAWWTNFSSAPALRIRFDGDPGPGYDRVQYKLRTYRSQTTIFNNGETEQFKIRSNGRIDLFNAK